LTTIIGVRFKPNGKMYYFDPQGVEVPVGTGVIVETARGLEYGECVQGNTEVPDQTVVQPLKRMARIAGENDLKILERNKKRADEAFSICKQKIADRELEMNLVAVECTFDMNKMLFYFTADGRVDFRELVKDLASIFRTRIELRQIGVRDEAKMIGGLGCCGRELCCSSYLEDFHPVSINMAKEQNLSLNPAKISGVCGRLMCCLKYEHEAYAELQKVTPKQGSVVDTPEGRGKVISTQMLRGTCKVQLDDSPEHSLTEFQCADCTQVRGVCRNRHNAAAMAEERRRREEEEAQLEEIPQQTPEHAPRPRPEKTAPQDVEGSALPEDGAEAPAEAAPRRRRRRGGRRRHKPADAEGAPQQEPQE
jgi:cell fate regulator YaaT (PSP1 superfamily)